jgi:hypothetical protein
MKISVLTNASGQIVGAFFTPPNARQPVGRAGVDQIKIPEKHRVHEVSVPPELAGELLEGKVATALFDYHLELKGETATLKPHASKK